MNKLLFYRDLGTILLNAECAFSGECRFFYKYFSSTTLRGKICKEISFLQAFNDSGITCRLDLSLSGAPRVYPPPY